MIVDPFTQAITALCEHLPPQRGCELYEARRDLALARVTEVLDDMVEQLRGEP